MTIHVTARVENGGRVVVDRLPFETGQEVELTIVTIASHSDVGGRYPLHGKPYRYEDPFGPSAHPDDWEAGS